MIHAGTAQWHDARRRTVGASEVAALFGVHPFMTYFELWNLKAGLIEEIDLETEAMEKGRFLEDGVAQWAAHRQGYTISRHQRFVTHPRAVGWSATPDYGCWSPWRDGPGRMEVKVTGDVPYDECPPHFAIQLQSQLACEDLQWGVVACLAAMPRTRLLPWEFDRNDTVIERIGEAIDIFWTSIRKGEPPAPDYHADADIIYRLYNRHDPGITVDLGGDERALELCAALLDARRREREAREEKEAVQAELVHKMGAAMVGRAGPYRIRSVVMPELPDRIITAADIGERLTGRAASRHLRIKEN